jgi:hypothetical protein
MVMVMVRVIVRVRARVTVRVRARGLGVREYLKIDQSTPLSAVPYLAASENIGLYNTLYTSSFKLTMRGAAICCVYESSWLLLCVEEMRREIKNEYTIYVSI